MRDALGLDSASQEATAKVAELVEHSRVTQARMDEIKSMQEPDLDEDLTPSQAWATMLGREREAMLQPPEMLSAPRLMPKSTRSDHDRDERIGVIAMMGLAACKASMPDDPLAPVLTRVISRPSRDRRWWMPGMWTGHRAASSRSGGWQPVDERCWSDGRGQRRRVRHRMAGCLP